MEDHELEALLDDIESDRVERKASLAEKDRACEAICAFANDLPDHRRPGVLFIGVNDDGSTVANFKATDELLRGLADFRENGNIYPFPRMIVQKRHLRGHETAVVIVEPSTLPPVRFRGRTWIRVGPRRAIATPEEERQLAEKRDSAQVPFDARPLSSARIDDLDLEFFRREYLPAAVARDVLERNERSLEQQLASVRFATVEGVPTTLGVLMLGLSPTDHLGGAYIQFLRLDGQDLTAPIKDRKELRGPLYQVLRETEELLRLNISTTVDLRSSPVERSQPNYPIVALEQLLRNAILHRNYQDTHAPARVTWFNDRVEIQNPGGPYGQVTIENFGQAGVTDYRNPNVAEALRVLGWVQRFGVGIPLARHELAENGNPPLEFTVNNAYVLATVRSAQ